MWNSELGPKIGDKGKKATQQGRKGQKNQTGQTEDMVGAGGPWGAGGDHDERSTRWGWEHANRSSFLTLSCWDGSDDIIQIKPDAQTRPPFLPCKAPLWRIQCKPEGAINEPRGFETQEKPHNLPSTGDLSKKIGPNLRGQSSGDQFDT